MAGVLTLADGRQRVTVLTTEPADQTAVTTTELAAGILASPKINKSDYRISASGSDTVPDQPLDQAGNATTYGNSNFEGGMTVLRFLDPTTGLPDVTDDALYAAVKTKGTRLWIVEREGPPAGQANAANDPYDIWEVITDDPQKPQDRNGYVKVRIPLGVQDHKTGVVAAGA